jgi:hypothetical protein
MSGFYQRNHLQDPTDFSEARERLERCEEAAGRWFADLTRPQLAAYNQRMSAIAPYRGSPRWDREQIAAKREWEAGTAEAKRVYQMALADLMTCGEIGAATESAFNEVLVGAAMLERVA